MRGTVALAYLLSTCVSAITVKTTNTESGATLLRGARAAENSTEALPDPVCRTGIVSLPLLPSNKQVCCPGYCGECGDYATCENVRGQASGNACCATKVLKLECGSGAAANVCLKPCSESLPPCIMDSGHVEPGPVPARHAGADCGKAVEDWRLKAAAAAGDNSGGACKEPAAISDGGILINFQPADFPVPSGYDKSIQTLADSGLKYGDRGNGRCYGWKYGPPTTAPRDRKDSVATPEANTIVVPDRDGTHPDEAWDFALPNGEYEVTVSFQDAGADVSTSGCRIEGLETSPNVYGDGTSVVKKGDGGHVTQILNVDDGKLTFAGSWAHDCSSINRIHIRSEA